MSFRSEKTAKRRFTDGGYTVAQLFAPFFCIVVYFVPEGLSFIGHGQVETACRALLVLAFLAMAVVQVYRSANGRGMPFDRVFLLIIALCAILGFCTVVNSGSFPHYAQKVTLILGAWLLIAVFAYEDPKRLLVAAFWAFLLISIVNIFGILYKYPESYRPIGDFWLFGQRNSMRIILFPALFFSIIRDKLNGKRISIPTIYLLISAPILLYLVQSMTSLVLIIVIEAFYLWTRFWNYPPSIISIFIGAYAVLEAFFLFVGKIGPISDFVVNVLHRSVTFSGRTEIWDLAMNAIGKSPLVGTGCQTLENSGLWTYSLTQVSHCHNAALDILYKGGAFALIIGLMLFVESCLPLVRAGKNWFSFLLGLFLGAFFISSIFGDFWYMQEFLFLFMAAYYKLFADNLGVGSIGSDND